MVAVGSKGSQSPNVQKLMDYWAHGEGSALIRWGVGGDFNRCVVRLGKYVPPTIVKGLCANLHRRATGADPGHAPGEKPPGTR